MKNISILAPKTAVMEAIADPRYLFTVANDFLISPRKQPLFNVQPVGVQKQDKLMNDLVTVQPDKTIAILTKTDLIFIPAISGDSTTALKKKYIPWLKEQHHKGADIAYLYIGAFVLAKTGLLNGKKCSTHWVSANEFLEMSPDVELVNGSIISEDNGLHTSGGANS